MSDPQQAEELAAARAETRELRATIDVLRAELDDAVRAREAAVTAACEVRDAEIRQLRDTVARLREDLEERALAPRVDPQRLEASEDIVRHLQGTVNKMRDQLEAQWAKNSDEVAALRRDFEQERRQLQDTVAKLRAELEGGRG